HIIAALLLDEDKDPGDSSSELDIIYKDNMLEFFRQNAVDDVFIRAKKKEVGELANEFLSMGVTIHFNINSVVDDLPNPRFTNVGEHSFVSAKIDRITIGQRIIKRAIDILAGIVGIIITGILFLILGPIIKIQAPGPVFFSQTRVGRNGRRFKIYKFRSMYTDAEERKKELMAQNQMQGFMFKMENDPRIFPAGNFIRKTSLDEFPQFINIFLGDMSLVGTRPPTEDEYDQYNMHHLSRLAMKPGLTGMWQVSGRSDITDFEEVVRLDNEYIRNFSLTLDVKIILKTFAVVFKHSGAK
nr:exopolysaccharide biosynthesis polyprenyl glycosylphosphotransferase [Eubacterium sp.]